MNDKKLVETIRQISKETFWEIWDTELMPLLNDFIKVRFDASKVKVETKAWIPEDRFNVLKWQGEKGSRLGDYQVAYAQHNVPQNWSHAFSLLKANNSFIANPFHEGDYEFEYWIYPQKYSDRIFRKRLSEAKS